MGDMEIVRQFNSELSTIYETKPPISKAKVTSVTRLAVKAIKYYKHVVQSIEKFAQKCRQEYKIPALYVIDSVIRQSRHQFGSEKDVYGPRFAKNITLTFQHIFRCSAEEQGKVIKVLNLWQKSGIYPPEVIQPLLNLPSTLQEADMGPTVDPINEPTEVLSESVDASEVSNPLTSVLEAQRQEHLQQIQLLQQKLQEQQRINEQQQQLLQQQQLPTIPSMPVVSGVQLAPHTSQPAYEAPQQSQVNTEISLMDATETPASSVPPSAVEQQQEHKFQLQPEVFAQIQALTGMNIRMPNQASAPDFVSGPQQSNIVQGNNTVAGPPSANQGPFHDNTNYGPSPGMPVWAPHGMGPGGIAPTQQSISQEEKRRTSVIDDFDYGDDDDDASRIAEQRRHLMEEERRLSQECHPPINEMQGEFQNTFRPVGEQPERHPGPAGPFGRRSPDLHHRERSPGDHYQKPRSPRRRSRSPKWRDRSPRRRSHSPFGRERERDRDRDRERDRDRDRGRNRDREREWHKDRDSDRERDKDRGRDSDREAEKKHDWIPAPKKETLSVCSTTIWVGHLGKTVAKEILLEMFEAHQLSVSSIDMVPPRGCAYVVMVHRKDASRGLIALKNERIHSNFIKLAWAPGKGVKGREYKEYFDTEQGVAYIPWNKLGSGVDFQALGDGGWIDPETLPPGAQNTVNEGSETGSTDNSNTKDDKDLGTMSHEELMKLAAAQASTDEKATEQAPPMNPLVQPPPRVPPPGSHMFPGHHPMIPPPMMIQPPFPGAPPLRNMVPPPNMTGVPPPNMGGPPLQFNPSGAPPANVRNGPPGPPPPNLGRPPEGGQFPPDNIRFPPPNLPQEGGPFPPQFPSRPQDNAQFPPQDNKFPPSRPDEGGQFPPHYPNDESQLPPRQPVEQFPPRHPSREGPFPPNHHVRPHDGGQFPPHHPGRFQGGHFPPMHHTPPPFYQRPPHHVRMPPFHPGGPRFPHDIPPLMPTGGPPRGADFGPPPWGPGPGPIRGPPPHGIPPPGWPDNRPPDEVRGLEERDSEGQEERPGDMTVIDKGNSMEQVEDERDFSRRPRREREHDDGERDRAREQNWERIRDRDDRGRERDDRARNRDRDDRFRNRDRGRDRERDRIRDRDWDRDWDRDRGDRRREREDYRPRDFIGERDGPRDAFRDGPRRRSRFEPMEEKLVSTQPGPIEYVFGENKGEQSSKIASSTVDNSQSELASREEGEIVEGNESEPVQIVADNETANHIPKDNGVTNVTIATETPKSSVGSEAANVAQHNKVMDIPMDNDAVNVPGDNFNTSKGKDGENVSLKDTNLCALQNDDKSVKLSKQEIKVDGETEQASS